MARLLYSNDIEDDDRLQLLAVRVPSAKRDVIHRGRRAQCLAWLLMSETMADYRAWRRTAGLPDDGGFIRHFIEEGVLVVTKLPKQ